MLSRRGVRIKVFQVLYSVSRDSTLTPRLARSAYAVSVKKSFELFQFALYSFAKICQISEEDADKRKAKYLPTDKDKNFKAKLYNNPIIQNIAQCRELYNTAEDKKFNELASIDFARKVYSEYSKTEEYKNYINSESTIDDHVEQLLDLFRFCRKNEYFLDVMDDGYANWIDDKSLVIGALKKVIKHDPQNPNILNPHRPEEEIVEEFGETLLRYYLDEEEELLEYVKPILENWDHERLAIIDTILINMALSEFLDFESIPVKVTINEYVELAKRYSTPKSKEFVNGILDKLLKKLDAEGVIKKSGRGLVD